MGGFRFAANTHTHTYTVIVQCAYGRFWVRFIKDKPLERLQSVFVRVAVCGEPTKYDLTVPIAKSARNVNRM